MCVCEVRWAEERRGEEGGGLWPGAGVPLLPRANLRDSGSGHLLWREWTPLQQGVQRIVPAIVVCVCVCAVSRADTGVSPRRGGESCAQVKKIGPAGFAFLFLVSLLLRRPGARAPTPPPTHRSRHDLPVRPSTLRNCAASCVGGTGGEQW